MALLQGVLALHVRLCVVETSGFKWFHFQQFTEAFTELGPDSVSLQCCASFHSPSSQVGQTLCPCQPPACEEGGCKQSRKPYMEGPGGAASCLLAGRREGAVYTSDKREKLGAPLRLFLRPEEKDSGSSSVLLCPCYLSEPHLFIQVAVPGFISF